MLDKTRDLPIIVHMGYEYLEKSYGIINAAVFTGEAFQNYERRMRLRSLMHRWTNELDNIVLDTPTLTKSSEATLEEDN